jgi:hypothetical protein
MSQFNKPHAAAKASAVRVIVQSRLASRREARCQNLLSKASPMVALCMSIGSREALNLLQHVRPSAPGMLEPHQKLCSFGKVLPKSRISDANLSAAPNVERRCYARSALP